MEKHSQASLKGSQTWEEILSLKASRQNMIDTTKFKKYQTKYVGEEEKVQKFLKCFQPL